MDATINTSLIGLSRAQDSINQSAHKIAGYHLEGKSPTPETKPTPDTKTLAGQQAEMTNNFYQNPLTKNTDLGEEVVNMIQSSRAYEANLRVVGVWSEMLKDEVNLLKK